jgi:hypothetical protein
MADFLLPSLRGGLNENPPTSLADDQCTVARNVEWWVSMLGERRLGSALVSFAGSPLAGCVRINWLYRHLPTINPADAQLWAAGVTPANALVLAYKDTAWHQVAMPDPPNMGGRTQFEMQGQTLHNKLFLAYHSNVDRLHCWDNGAAALRRAGLAAPTGAPVPSQVGTGTMNGTRHYRARFIIQGKLRSEPSPVASITPVNWSSVSIAPPAGPGEGETAWECEASVNAGDYYRIATLPIGTPANDAIPYEQGYATSYPLSDESGAYNVLPSVRLLTVEQDRLMGGGSFMDPAQESSVLWTPVFGDPSGIGNDERFPISSSNSLSLDNFEGGGLTNLSATVNGYVYATKWSHIYQLTRSGLRAHAYEVLALTKQRGALPGSLVEALDQSGNPSPFMLDPDIGPCRIGPRGVEPCGADIRVTWNSVDIDAPYIHARGCYFSEKKQVHWWVPVVGSGARLRLVLHTQEMRSAPDGMRCGWALWEGYSAQAIAVCMFADNVDSNGPRSNVLVPFLGMNDGNLILRSDTGTSDAGQAYNAMIRTRPFVQGSLLHQWEAASAMLLAGAVPGGVLDITLRADFGLQVKKVSGVKLDPVAGEMRVIKNLDDLGLAELRTLQIVFEDAPIPTTTQWTLEAFAIKQTGGATS